MDCCCRAGSGLIASPGRRSAAACSTTRRRSAAGSGRPTSPEFETSTGGIWRICALIDYATKYCLAATLTPTARGDALACLHAAVAEAQRLLGLEDLRADRGEVDLVDEPTGELLRTVPAPIAAVSDNGPCFRGETYAAAFAGEDPLLRHVRTGVRSPQTNGVIERYFGTLKYEHLFRGQINDGDALAVEINRFRQIYNTVRPHQVIGDRTPRGLPRRLVVQPKPHTVTTVPF